MSIGLRWSDIDFGRHRLTVKQASTIIDDVELWSSSWRMLPGSAMARARAASDQQERRRCSEVDEVIDSSRRPLV
jgi:hypothetical protein